MVGVLGSVDAELSLFLLVSLPFTIW
jgi:hypothetical protein